MQGKLVWAHCLVLIATALVAGSFIASAKLASLISPYSLTLLRFLCSALVLAPVILLQPELRVQVLPALPRAMVISFFFSAFFVCMFEALRTTSSLNTAAIYTLVPLITAVLSRTALGDELAPGRVAIYLLGAVSACWVILTSQPAAALTLSINTGDLIFLGGAVLMGCYAVSMKLLYRKDDMIVMVFGILVGGTVWMSFALLATGAELGWQRLEGPHIQYMIYLVFGATIGTVYLFQRTIVALGPSRVNAYIYLNPALVALLAFIIDGARISIVVLPGILLSVTATFLLQRRARGPV